MFSCYDRKNLFPLKKCNEYSGDYICVDVIDMKKNILIKMLYNFSYKMYFISLHLGAYLWIYVRGVMWSRPPRNLKHNVNK